MFFHPVDHLAQIPGPDLVTAVVLPMSDIYWTMARHKWALLRRAGAGLELTLNFKFSYSKIKNHVHRFPCTYKVINQYQVNPVILSNILPPVNDYNERSLSRLSAKSCIGAVISQQALIHEVRQQSQMHTEFDAGYCVPSGTGGRIRLASN